MTIEEFAISFYHDYTEVLRETVQVCKDFSLFNQQYEKLKGIYIEKYNTEALSLFKLIDLKWVTKKDTRHNWNFSPFNHFNLILDFEGYTETIDLNSINYE